ncbi:hypothetical protein [Paenibacillus spongiae]|uniref:Uncharacterized protein n=1 Tax=Paenibacillus spongiae TaxID=2909671 RepID=A0ABY5S435_9BACL|nr:hypothetical protein [Paenibacillus spongiae]UVI27483.1 hypothetical protein L1F29_18610 [Paenibacillus spongiae]
MYIRWFEENLPNPPYYEDNNVIKAVTWFKDTPQSREMLIRLKPFFQLAEKYGAKLIRSVSAEPPGVIVYEDDYQIAVTRFFPSALI